MTAYRFSEDEFLFLAYHSGLHHLPGWCRSDPEQIHSETIIHSLMQKGFLLADSQSAVFLHPVIAYVFYLMKSSAVWCGFDQTALLYLHEKRYILLEKERESRIRMMPMENAATCFTYLEESAYFNKGQILYNDTDPKAETEAADLKNRMEAYFEQ